MEDDQGSNRRVATRATRWEFLDDWIGVKLSDVYRKLISIHNHYAGLRSDNFYPAGWQSWQTQFNPQGYGVDVNRQIMIYHRWGAGDNGKAQRFIVVVNFSTQDQVVDVPFPANDIWTDLLNDGISSTVNNFWIRNWRVNSSWGNIFYKEG